MPVAHAVAPCVSEGEADRHPLLRGIEAEGGGEVERNDHHAHNHDGGAGNVEVLDQRIHHQPPGQAFHRQGMQPTEMTRDQTEDGGRKYQVEQNPGDLGGWGTGRARAQPRPAQSAQHQGDEEGGDAFQLQQQVADGRADHPSPVVGLPAGSAHGVQGRIRGVIGSQRKEEEARGHKEHHACDFIQATVAGRGQCQFEWLHGGYAGLAAWSTARSGRQIRNARVG